jgi:hypothetical protein
MMADSGFDWLDTDTDGVVNPSPADTTGDDCWWDPVMLDLDGDAYVDGWMWDTDGSGRLDTVALDRDADGVWDLKAWDLDGDGHLDVIDDHWPAEDAPGLRTDVVLIGGYDPLDDPSTADPRGDGEFTTIGGPTDPFPISDDVGDYGRADDLWDAIMSMPSEGSATNYPSPYWTWHSPLFSGPLSSSNWGWIP